MNVKSDQRVQFVQKQTRYRQQQNDKIRRLPTLFCYCLVKAYVYEGDFSL